MEVISSTSFGAKPIKPVYIQKLNSKKGRFDFVKAHFVKLEADNRNDLDAMQSIAKMWKSSLYVKKIATASRWMDYLPIDIYALTTQTKDFKNLRPNKILGVAEIRNDPNFDEFKQLTHLQVKPEAINVNKKDNQYKKVGTEILNSLKGIYDRISLYSVNNYNVERFYRRNHFIDDYKNCGRFVWSSKLFDRIKYHIKNFVIDLFTI